MKNGTPNRATAKVLGQFENAVQSDKKSANVLKIKRAVFINETTEKTFAKVILLSGRHWGVSHIFEEQATQ